LGRLVGEFNSSQRFPSWFQFCRLCVCGRVSCLLIVVDSDRVVSKDWCSSLQISVTEKGGIQVSSL